MVVLGKHELTVSMAGFSQYNFGGFVKSEREVSTRFMIPHLHTEMCVRVGICGEGMVILLGRADSGGKGGQSEDGDERGLRGDYECGRRGAGLLKFVDYSFCVDPSAVQQVHNRSIDIIESVG